MSRLGGVLPGMVVVLRVLVDPDQISGLACSVLGRLQWRAVCEGGQENGRPCWPARERPSAQSVHPLGERVRLGTLTKLRRNR